MSKILEDPHNILIHYLGADIDAGPLPAFIYFALSGQESLELHPYCQPVQHLLNPSLRVFSFTIPGHEEGMNKFHAMNFWAESIEKENDLLESFFEHVVTSIHWLIEQKIIDSSKIAVGGLSRGGFVATHIAAKIPFIHSILGFAPLTELMQLKEFSSMPHLKRKAETLDLIHLVDDLAHIRNLRFYIGNLDTRVGTDACYRFIRRLAEKGHEKRTRHQKIELMVTHSIGHKGHGTDPHIFEEGAAWIKNHLLGI